MASMGGFPGQDSSHDLNVYLGGGGQMAHSYRVVAAGVCDVDVLGPQEFFDQCKDMDEPDEEGTLALAVRSGSDGIAVTGTRTELSDWLRRSLAALDGGFCIERYVFVEIDGSDEQAYALRDACGMTPGDFGRWKGGSKVLISGFELADRAIRWAVENSHPYEISETRRVMPS